MQFPVLGDIEFPVVNGVKSVHCDTRLSSKKALISPVAGLYEILKSYQIFGSTIMSSSVIRVMEFEFTSYI